jgi:hypothetical protein
MCAVSVEADRMIGEPEVVLHSPAWECQHSTAEPGATPYEHLCATPQPHLQNTYWLY